MTFSEALKLAKKGWAIRRKGVVIRMHIDGMGVRYLYVRVPNEPLARKTWLPTTTDLFAEDWEVCW